MSQVSCVPAPDKDPMCNMCSNRKGQQPQLMYWQISSTNPNRKKVFVLCDECIEKINKDSGG